MATPLFQQEIVWCYLMVICQDGTKERALSSAMLILLSTNYRDHKPSLTEPHGQQSWVPSFLQVQLSILCPSALGSENIGSVLKAYNCPAAHYLTPDCYCLATQLCLTLCDSMDCSTPGFPVLHHLWVCSNSCPSSQWCHPTISSSVIPFSSCLQSFPTSGSFLMSWLFASGGQSIGAPTSASVLPMNIQDWFPLGLTGLISLQTKGLSRDFSTTTVQKHQFFSVQPSLWSNSHIHTWLLEKP